MNLVSDLHAELQDVVMRIERLNDLLSLHRQQPEPDRLALEGYARLKRQYAEQLMELLQELELDVEFRWKAA